MEPPCLMDAPKPPSSPELERAVLGALMNGDKAWTRAGELLRPELFLSEPFRHVFKAAHGLWVKSKPVDMLTVTESLRADGLLDAVGGPVEVVAIAQAVTGSAHIEHHARILIAHHVSRSLIDIGAQAMREGYENADALDLLDRISASVTDLYSWTQPIHLLNAGTGIHELTDGTPSTHYRFGISELDSLCVWEAGLPHVFAGRPGIGKCLGRGTLVMLFDGSMRAVEDVREGDLLMGPDSKPRRVLGTTFGTGPLYRVKQRKGISYVVNEAHVLSLKRSGSDGYSVHGDITNISVSQWLTRSDKFKIRNKGYKASSIRFPDQEVPLEPYYLGAWLGDGTSRTQEIAVSDSAIADYIGEYSGRLGLKYTTKNDRNGCVRTSITHGKGSGRFTKEETATPIKHLRDLDLIRNKHIPPIYLANSEEKRLELLAGIIDTDGHLINGTFEVTQKNERLAKDIVHLANTLGFRATCRVKQAVLSDRNYSCPVHRIFISGDIDRIPTKIHYKQAPARKINKDWKVTSIDIEPIGEGEYFGFEVDGDHLFLLEDLTVTHNSIFCVEVCWHHTLKGPVLLFSPEMTLRQVQSRVIAREAGVPYQNILRKVLSAQEQEEVAKTALRLSGRLQLMKVDPTGGITPDQIRVRTERAMKTEGITAFAVDHLHKMKTGNPKTDRDDFARISQCMNGVTEVAKNTMLPALVMCQLNREVEKRTDKRPNMADLRGSGEIEQDAAVVGLLYREGYYSDKPPHEDKLEISIAKNRDGSVGLAKAAIVPAFSRIGPAPENQNTAPF